MSTKCKADFSSEYQQNKFIDDLSLDLGSALLRLKSILAVFIFMLKQAWTKLGPIRMYVLHIYGIPQSATASTLERSHGSHAWTGSHLGGCQLFLQARLHVACKICHVRDTSVHTKPRG